MKSTLRQLLTGLALLLLAAASSSAATFTVNPSGNCAADSANIQNAIYAAQGGDTIQLTAGTYDLSCLAPSGNSIFLPYWLASITLAGDPGQTILVGPGMADANEMTGLFVAAGGSSITGLTMRGFYVAVSLAGTQRNTGRGISVSNCRFEQNIVGVQVNAQHSPAGQVVGNTFIISAPPGPLYSDFDSTFGVLAFRQNSGLLIANNTFTGPGPNAHFNRAEDLLASGITEDLGIVTFGIHQVDPRAPASTYARVSNNTASGLDLAIHVSSDHAVMNNNTVTDSAVALMLSNSGRSAPLADGLVTGNSATASQFGFVLFSGVRSTISINDFRNNSVAGLLFTSNPNGEDASDANNFILDQGSKLGVAGNQGGPIWKQIAKGQ